MTPRELSAASHFSLVLVMGPAGPFPGRDTLSIVDGVGSLTFRDCRIADGLPSEGAWRRVKFPVNQSTVERIQRAIIASDLLDLADRYDAGFLDGSLAAVYLLADRESKRVVCRQAFPESLLRFVGALRAILFEMEPSLLDRAEAIADAERFRVEQEAAKHFPGGCGPCNLTAHAD